MDADFFTMYIHDPSDAIEMIDKFTPAPPTRNLNPRKSGMSSAADIRRAAARRRIEEIEADRETRQAMAEVWDVC